MDSMEAFLEGLWKTTEQSVYARTETRISQVRNTSAKDSITKCCSQLVVHSACTARRSISPGFPRRPPFYFSGKLSTE